MASTLDINLTMVFFQFQCYWSEGTQLLRNHSNEGVICLHGISLKSWMASFLIICQDELRSSFHFAQAL